MIARRLSSQTNPEAYFARKHQQEAKERGEYVDIHDIGGPYPEDYNVLISDIKHQRLETTIARELGIPYLSRVREAEAKVKVKVGNGYIRGLTDRAIVPFIVGHKDEARWVFFILDSGAPLTYLSDQVSGRNDMPYLREEANQYRQWISSVCLRLPREPALPLVDIIIILYNPKECSLLGY